MAMDALAFCAYRAALVGTKKTHHKEPHQAAETQFHLEASGRLGPETQAQGAGK